LLCLFDHTLYQPNGFAALNRPIGAVALLGTISYTPVMLHTFLIFLGGGLGAAGRHFVGLAALRQFGPGFPYGTLIVNVTGSLLMGLFIGWLVNRGGAASSNDVRLFFATGILGGFTTFSAYSLDIANLWERGAIGPAFGYALGMVLVCVVAVFAGLWLARALSG
jgi:CrcB protein